MRGAVRCFAYGLAIGCAFLGLSSGVEAQVKPRFMIAFDTSGSMAWRLSDNTSMGNGGGIGRPAVAGDPANLVRDGVYYGCGTFGGLDNDGDCFPDDSRMFVAKEAVRNMLLSFGDVEWALARFTQNQGDFVYSVSGLNSNCSTCGAQNLTAHYQGWGSGTCNGQVDTSGQVVVGFPYIASENHANKDNVTSLLKWMDNVETNYQTPLGASVRDLCNHANGGDCELFAHYVDNNNAAYTPLGGLLRAAYNYMQPIRSADATANCRPYSVILITDGDETCDTAPATRATELLNNGIKTYVVGFATTTTSLNAIATNGGTGTPYFAANQAQLSAALSSIVAASLKSETCNGLDDDCDGVTDEDLPVGQFLSCDLGGKRSAAQNTQVQQIRNSAGTLLYPTITATTPLPGKVVCGSVADLCTGNLSCVGACSDRDDDCDGIKDEDGTKNACNVCPGAVDTCNGLDDDCDGYVDNTPGTTVPFNLCGAPASCTGNVSCGLGVGQCNLGTRTCTAGVLGPCVGAGSPGTEICDLIDNDCNGLVDDISRVCPVGTDVGECNRGTQFCRTAGQTGDANGWRLHAAGDPLPGQAWCEGQVLATPELCDNLDQNCDGSNTAGVTAVSDPRLGASCGPGVAECDGIVACNTVTETTYCMGVRPQPYSAETCNGMDEDCDGTTDENAVASMGGGPTGAFCGTTATNNGECNTGGFACVAGSWACVGEIPPSNELCDLLNNDCDGATDERETPNVDPRLDAVCGTDVGECVAGASQCIAGAPSCTPMQGPVAEICDGKDNDCDGLTDEMVLAANDNRVGVACSTNAGGGLVAPATQPCPGGAGTCDCTLGLTACSTGAIVCQGNVGPQTETCDDFDNDCDGVKDDGNPQGGGACGTTTGECTAGMYQCQAGNLVCQGGQGPVTEICDGLDNDCDGQNDDGVTPGTDPQLGQSCTVNAGTGALILTSDEPCPAGANTCSCELGATACSGGGVVCTGYVLPQTETCNDFDDDCDGTKDNGNPGGGGSCGTDEGQCTFGNYQCLGGNLVCQGGQQPVPELCDGLDNNCNGQVDDAVSSTTDPALGVSCYENTTTGALILTSTQPCPAGAGTCSCALGLTGCSGGGVVCTNHVLPQTELCDDFDNDCDGTKDDGNPQGGGVCGTNAGECSTGNFQCVTGNLLCQGGQGPVTEICNGLDDDCDGQIDDGVSPATDANLGLSCRTDPVDGDVILTSTQPCPLGANTCPCTLGATVCSSGGIICDDMGPEPELCDGVDNDCDGTRDEAELPNPDPRLDVLCGTGIGECEPGPTSCVSGAPACTPLVGPVTESCNGKDDNCNGLTDDNIPGDGSDECWNVALNPNPGVGTCKKGVERCINSTPTCDGEIRPALEVCDGLDSNCNGIADDQASENPGGGQICGSDVGICETGLTQCVHQGNLWFLACNGETASGTEICNGADDDCDGLTDEGDLAGGDCYEDGAGVDLDPQDGTGVSGVGECHDGVFACQVPVDGGGAPTGPARNVCVNAQGPSAEFCDAKDNDCDGVVDEGNPPGAVGASDAPCGSDLGECMAGSLLCSGGQQICDEEVGPSVEICDGLNNDCDQVCTTPTDCDEQIDEGIPLGEACSISGKGDVGECVPGRWICAPLGQSCDGEVFPAAEVCDALDNDCDGNIDENLGVGGACGKDEGECAEGTQQCVKGLLVCVGAIPEQAETCDCNDNDCDGESDEAPDTGALCPSGSACVQCQCALPCSDEGEFGIRCPQGKAAVEQGGTCYCVGSACDDAECATETIERDGAVLCSPTSELGTCECKSNACAFRCDGVSCSDGTVCNPLTGACERESCVLPQFKCAEDERCNGESGECEADPCAAAGCDADEACRDGSCFGSCAKVECDSGEACKAGECQVDPCAAVSCPRGQACNPADGSCVSPDPCVVSNCGSGLVCDVVEGCVSDPCLGTNCPARQICALGECVARCASAEVDCNETCVDPLTDPTHCGASDDCTGSAAGTACADGEFCVAGGCATSCPEGRVGCDGRCIDPLTDEGHCGASTDCAGPNAGSACQGGTTCEDGSCVAFTQPGTDAGASQVDAGAGAEDRPDDRTRVIAAGGGGCACSVPAASQSPTRGTTAWSLAFGLLGVLVFRRRRSSPRLVRNAVSGGLTALLVTLAGPSQGCNVEPFCLDCGEPKLDGDSGTDEGVGGGGAGRDAGGGGSGGTDAQVPDSGGQDLPDGSTPDSGGKPVESCNGEDDDDDDKVDEGFDLDTDLSHCGACGQACVPAHAFGECVDGECGVRGCDVGFLDLNEDAADGCEYGCIPSTDDDTICDFKDNDCDGTVDEDLDLDTDVRNCGDCGSTCSFLNAAGAASCVGGDCVFDPGACDSGWHDQDGNPANGCEYACVKNPASPNAELCNLADDDCDRDVDEGVSDLGSGRTVGATCGTNEGYCIAGTWACTGGQPVCAGQRGPITETCNGVDDDCNGTIDLGTPAIGQQCGSATGACNPGQLVIPPGGCSAGVGLACGGPSFVGPAPEVCNGVDDDCDNLIDEPDAITGLKPEAGQECTNDQSMPRGINFAPTSTEDGECQHGLTVCASGLLVCQGEIVPATELCDFKDNDCDAVVDDNMIAGGSDPQIGDDCGEDRGQCTAGSIICNASGQYFCDRSGQVGPAAETCDGVDNDCDGTIDEAAGANPVDPNNYGAQGGQSCEVDATSGDLVLTTTERCAPGGANCPCTLGVSVCSAGNLGCLGYVMPSTELCDTTDNDCDGTVNDGNPGGGGTCGSILGECGKQRGSYVCSGGTQVCVGAATPGIEICDGLDNDCDGLVDDGVTAAADPRLAVACFTNGAGGLVLGSASRCAPGVPCPCTLGATVCSAGVIACSGDVGPGTETCDNVDNDCDGVRDEGNPGGGGSCGTDVGECSKGSFVCTNGAQVCTGGQGAVAETCDGLDNDCDNLVDDAIQVTDDARLAKACRVNPSTGLLDTSGASPCAPGVPCSCALGTTVCAAGAIDCSGDVGPGTETCNDFDDDCDGVKDDGNPGGGGSCGSTVGECGTDLGNFVCTAGAQVCMGAKTPGTEICNGLDDDCDGLIDDGVTSVQDNRLGQSCRTNPSTGALVLTSTNPCPLGAGTCPCGLGATICSAGAIACGGDTGPGTETCDTLDNDCDGVINDGNPGGGGTCGTTTGQCEPGSYTCTTAGTLVCNGGTQPAVEICDGLDNDCNGVADDNVLPANDPTVGQSCYDNASGTLVLSSANRCPGGPGTCPCTLGATVCSAGTLLCSGDVGPSPELCDSFDQNCDGNAYAGVIDLGQGRVTGAACGTSTGECSQGTWACNTGTVVCNVPSPLQAAPLPETCDGKDNDCDGTADDGNPGGGGSCPADASRAIPPCTAGTMTCKFGSLQCEYPNGATLPTTEVCDSVDNDCDGTINEGFTPYTSILHCGGCNLPCNFPGAVGDPQAIATCKTVGMAQSCDIQACKTGYVNRDGNYANGCEYQCTISGTVDVCDGINNDCDFATDEDTSTVPAQVCVPKNTGVCASNAAALTPGCVTGTPTCVIPANIHPEYQATETKCDGLDNDCDSKVDEGYDVGVACNNAPAQGVCFTTGAKQCNLATDGTTCVLNPAPLAATTEICDGKDNNCDGIVDNYVAPIPPATVSGIDYVKIVDAAKDVYMMRYEASRADAVALPAPTAGVATQSVCSKPGVFPWANVNWDEARAACCSLNAPPNGACTGATGWRLCDAPDWETGCEGPAGTCDWAYDDVSVPQNDITVTTCTTYAGPVSGPHASGTSSTHVINVPAMGTVTDVNVLNLEGDTNSFDVIGFTLAHGATTRQLLYNNNCGGDNDWRLGFDDAGTTGAFGSGDCTGGDNGDGLTFVPAQSLAAFNTMAANGDWTLTVQNTANCCGGSNLSAAHTLVSWSLQVCYSNVVAQTAPLCSADDPSFAETCNGSEVGPATCSNGGDDCAGVTASSEFPECYADWGASAQIYDLSGNLKEWTNTSPLTDVYYLRGGSYNNVEDGRVCDFGITSANKAFRFPTTGFRCCYYQP
jgi:Notch-like protein